MKHLSDSNDYVTIYLLMCAVWWCFPALCVKPFQELNRFLCISYVADN